MKEEKSRLYQSMQKKHLRKFNLYSWLNILRKIGIERHFLILIKNTYKNPTANILGGERLNVFLLSLGTRQRLSIYSHHFSSQSSKILVKYIRQDRKIKDILIIKEGVIFLLFVDDVISYIENPRDSAKLFDINQQIQ